MLKVMIAEDDLVMADMLEEILVGGGYEVCGIARTVQEGVDLDARHKPDLAVLDVRLGNGGRGTDIGAQIDRPGGPGILYATGNMDQIDLRKANGKAFLMKPYGSDDMLRALQIVAQIGSTGKASQPFPRGFYIVTPPVEDQQAEFAEPEVVAKVANGQAAEIRRLRLQQQALAGFGSFALGEQNLEKILTEAARVCAESMEVSFCKVCRYRPEHNDLLVEAGVGWHQGVIGRVISQPDESSPQGRAFVAGKPVICDDLRHDSSFVLPAFYHEHAIVSTVDVVIKTAGQPYGVLEIDSPIQHDYNEHDIDFLTGFANVLAEAVNSFKRNGALKNAVDRMEEMVADRDRLLAAKNVVLEEKNSLLDDKNILLAEKIRLLEEKNVMAQELQHRVRNNLQLVYGMLNKQSEITTDAAGKEGIGGIARRVMTLAQVYDHLLGTGLSRTIDFGGYLKSLCASIESMQTGQHPDIVMTCQSASVTLDLNTVTALGLVVSELLSNSYDHAFPAGAGTISISLSGGEPGGEGTIVFADDGVGFTVTSDSKRHGLGLVRRLMQQVNGTVSVISDHGTQWTLRFPLPVVALEVREA